jgi:NhaP-type Na+/H+ or K+/H+ antiporter
MNIEGYNALIGLILPLVVGFLTTRSMPSEVKSLISVVLIILTALGSTAIAGQFNFQSIGEALVTIGVIHQASYSLFTKYFAGALQDVGPIKDKPSVNQTA